MKEYVSVEELNAATILLTGIPVSNLVEVHIARSIVTAISTDAEGELTTYRLLIGAPEADEDEAESVDWFEPATKGIVDAEEAEEDVGT